MSASVEVRDADPSPPSQSLAPSGEPEGGRSGDEGPPLVDRELSWLDFNGRVLQEASDSTVPLFDRLAFLGIFARNLDEFFRVRVASLRRLLRLKKKKAQRLSIDPRELLDAIHDVVSAQHAWFRRVFQDEIVPALAAHGIVLSDDQQADAELTRRAAAFFEAEVLPHLDVVILDREGPPPALKNDTVYLAVELFPAGPVQVGHATPEVALIRVPSPPVNRFPSFTMDDGTTCVLFVDDVIRLNLDELFPDRRVAGAWSIEVSRDAELYLEQEFAVDVVDAIRKSLSKRETGAVTRFLYDPEMPVGVLQVLCDVLHLADEDLLEGERYHHLGDLIDFPRCGVEGENYPPHPPVPHPELPDGVPVADAVSRGDVLLHFPYQPFEHVVRFLTEAAEDPTVTSIRLTIYRVSKRSRVLAALMDAADRGKDVRVFVEAKARFDEESNLEWAARLEDSGIVTYYSFPDLKVHAKVALVGRARDDGTTDYQAYLGTGNFNEDTARVYTDFGLLTSDADLTGEIATLFGFLEGSVPEPRFRHLIVAPFSVRERFGALIDQERRRAVRGEPAEIVLKLNALEDEAMIDHLRTAAADGVRIRGIVRGICCWTPEEARWGDRVELRSIVDRYLEHGRAYVFGGLERGAIYLGSADWMYRNLSRRVEVIFPVRDPRCRAEVRRILELQLADNVKARRLCLEGAHRRVESQGPPVRAQEAIYRRFERRARRGADS